MRERSGAGMCAHVCRSVHENLQENDKNPNKFKTHVYGEKVIVLIILMSVRPPVQRLSVSAYQCRHLVRNAGFLFAAFKLVHVHISSAFKCSVRTPSGPLCVQRRDCDKFSNVTMISFRWSSQSPCIIAIVVMITHAHSHAHSHPHSLIP